MSGGRLPWGELVVRRKDSKVITRAVPTDSADPVLIVTNLGERKTRT